ncbi:hypothetical protein [Kitasatospora sp. NPDC001132]
MAAKKRPGELRFLDALHTGGNAVTCQCPQPEKCVLRLQLPPPRGSFLDGQLRRWMVVGRSQVADPVTGAIRNTTIVIQRVTAGEPVERTFTCAGPVKVENRYDSRRLHRPPTRVRISDSFDVRQTS